MYVWLVRMLTTTLALGSASCMRLSEATAIRRSAGLIIDGPIPSRQDRDAHGLLIGRWRAGYRCVCRLHTVEQHVSTLQA